MEPSPDRFILTWADDDTRRFAYVTDTRLNLLGYVILSPNGQWDALERDRAYRRISNRATPYAAARDVAAYAGNRREV